MAVADFAAGLIPQRRLPGHQSIRIDSIGLTSEQAVQTSHMSREFGR
jgi:hypothetical protein